MESVIEPTKAPMAGGRDAGMQLSALKLESPHWRTLHSARLTLHSNLANVISSPTSPCGSPSLSPRLSDARIDAGEFTSFKQHYAAILIKWGETPGTPENGGKSATEEESGSQEHDTFATWSSSNSKSEDFSTGKSDVHVNTVESCPSTNENKPTDHFALLKTHILPLKPPPRMQAAKQPLVLAKDDNSVGRRSFSSVITNITPRKSFRKDRLKALPFLTSQRKDHKYEEVMSTMLGFEDWPKLKNGGAGGEHHRPSLSFSFRKKPEEKEDEVDPMSNEELSQKGGLGESRPLSSISCRGLTDASNFRSKSWASDSDSDCELDAKTVFFDSTEEDTGKDRQQQEKDLMREVDPIESLKQKPKKHAFTKLTHFFRSTTSTPSPTSSVSAVPLPALPSQSVKAKRASNPQGTSTNTLQKLCLSNAVGQALIRNVKQIGQFDIHPRCAAAK